MILQHGLGGLYISQAAILFALFTMGDDEQSGDDDKVFNVVRHQHVTPLGTLRTFIFMSDCRSCPVRRLHHCVCVCVCVCRAVSCLCTRPPIAESDSCGARSARGRRKGATEAAAPPRAARFAACSSVTCFSAISARFLDVLSHCGVVSLAYDGKALLFRLLPHFFPPALALSLSFSFPPSLCPFVPLSFAQLLVRQARLC